MNLHAAAVVAHRSAQSKLARETIDKRTKADALHYTGHLDQEVLFIAKKIWFSTHFQTSYVIRVFSHRIIHLQLQEYDSSTASGNREPGQGVGIALHGFLGEPLQSTQGRIDQGHHGTNADYAEADGHGDHPEGI